MVVDDVLRTAALMLPLFKRLDKQIAFTVACCHSADTPIIFASSAFFELTGFSQEEVLGKNCRFMQGNRTSRQQVLEIRSALMEDRTSEACILNYKRDGTPFWNQLLIAPMTDDSGAQMYLLGIQADVSDFLDQAQSGEAAEVFGCCHETARVQKQQAQEILAILQKWRAPQAGMEPLNAAQNVSSTPNLPASLLAPLLKLRHSFVLADPHQPDTPMCYASPMFLSLTGYPREMVLGRNCRFLQGRGTDKAELQRLHNALCSTPPQAVTVRLLNYRRDGSPFWNHLHVSPVRDSLGQVAYFVGVQLDITLSPQAETLSDLDARRHTCPDEVLGHRQQPACALRDASQGPGPLTSTSSAPVDTLQACEPSNRAKRVQQSVVGAVRVACRSLGGAENGLRRSADCQRRASMDYPLRRLSIDAQGLRRSVEGVVFQLPSRLSQ